MWPKKWCPHCGHRYVRRFGWTPNGRQRFQCGRCLRTFVWSEPSNKHLRQRHWFQLWVTESYSVRQLRTLSGHSRNKLLQILYHWLDQTPEEAHDYRPYRYLLFDGTYFHKRGCLIVMMDSKTQRILIRDYVDKESFESVYPALCQLKSQDLDPAYVTVDGHPHVIEAFRQAWPSIIVQRCLYHIQREGLRWLRTFPKTEAGRALRVILSTLTSVRSVADRDQFLDLFDQWQEKHSAFVRSLPRTTVAYKDPKRTVALICNARTDMFHYLQIPSIRSTTNLLEGFFSRLKTDFQRHRGLSERHKISYLQWYCHFHNQKISTRNGY